QSSRRPCPRASTRSGRIAARTPSGPGSSRGCGPARLRWRERRRPVAPPACEPPAGTLRPPTLCRPPTLRLSPTLPRAEEATEVTVEASQEPMRLDDVVHVHGRTIGEACRIGLGELTTESGALRPLVVLADRHESEGARSAARATQAHEPEVITLRQDPDAALDVTPSA